MNEAIDAGFHDVRHSAGLGDYDRNAKRHCFDDGETKGLGLCRSVNEHCHSGEVGTNIVLEAGKDDL